MIGNQTNSLVFFSPRFFEKTGLEFNDIEKSYQKYQNSKDAILFSSFLPETYYWLNPWEQGEWINPGVGKISNLIAKKSEFQTILQTFQYQLINLYSVII